MEAAIHWSNDGCTIQLPKEKGQMKIANQLTEEMTAVPMVALFLKEWQILAISQKNSRKKYDRVICFQPEWAIEPCYLQNYLEKMAHKNGWIEAPPSKEIPILQEKILADYMEEVFQLLQWLGYHFVSHETSKEAELPVKKQGKPQHRWSKEVSVIPFKTDYLNTKATIYWHKRNEMLIKAGAHLLAEPPLNKDGSLGFSARFGLKIREEHAASFNDQWTTTEDIILKSVNEVGLFLYFAGTNSWLQFKDETGKTMEEWTVVN